MRRTEKQSTNSEAVWKRERILPKVGGGKKKRSGALGLSERKRSIDPFQNEQTMDWRSGGVEGSRESRYLTTQ